jgi:hypothetical protein
MGRCASPKSAFRLETLWTAATATERVSYQLTLTNLSGEPATGFRLCVSGPGRLEILGAVQGHGGADASAPPAAYLTDAPTTEIETAPVRACEGRPRLYDPGV